jgi:hypothetical protein
MAGRLAIKRQTGYFLNDDCAEGATKQTEKTDKVILKYGRVAHASTSPPPLNRPLDAFTEMR